nr:MAG TPA: hypothetical protein [Caudoviricetes sp.]
MFTRSSIKLLIIRSFWKCIQTLKSVNIIIYSELVLYIRIPTVFFFG